MEPVVPVAAPNETLTAAAPKRLPLRFSGSGGEYFGIWIVNLLLTILSLGVYSAWAKVRRLQYFYRHTELADARFDFRGRPLSILLGRVVALVLLLIYSYGTRHPSGFTLIAILIIGLLMPWLLRNSFRFRLYNSSWRGLRFGFHGSVAGAYRVFLLNGVLMLVTLYLLAPFFHHRLKRYQHGHTSLGRTTASFDASLGQFYRIYLLIFLSVVAAGAIFAVVGGAAFVQMMHTARGAQPDPAAAMRVFWSMFVVVLLFSLFIGPFFYTRLANLIWNHTQIGAHRIECRQSALRLMWIQVSNLLLMVVTLGLFYPWAAVRVMRFQIDALSVLAVTDLGEFEAAADTPTSAIGEETASLLDFDISL
ncbi:MAG: conserved rane protein of unknown function [Nevskia sp.]|nr:conserved rane protein of unknown function [Nevskia sp.]